MKKPNQYKILDFMLERYGRTKEACALASKEYNRQIEMYDKRMGIYYTFYGFYITDQNGTLIPPKKVKTNNLNITTFLDGTGLLTKHTEFFE